MLGWLDGGRGIIVPKNCIGIKMKLWTGLLCVISTQKRDYVRGIHWKYHDLSIGHENKATSDAIYGEDPLNSISLSVNDVTTIVSLMSMPISW